MDPTSDAVAAEPQAPVSRPPRQSRQFQERRAKYLRVLMVIGIFASVLGSGFIDVAETKIQAIWTVLTADRSLPVVHTAKISRPMLDGTFCHTTVFDASSSQTIEDKVEFCDQRRQTSIAKPRAEFAWPGSR